jgi:hypothetical protein
MIPPNDRKQLDMLTIIQRNWMTRNDLPDLLNLLGLMGQGVEVGVRAGEFSKVILDKWNGERFIAVDAWRHLPDYRDMANTTDEEHHKFKMMTRDVLAAAASRTGLATHMLEMLSRDAATHLASYFSPPARPDVELDFVYLDADHSFDAVWQDLCLWEPLVKKGGIISGHDYKDGDLCEGVFGVKRAVDKFSRLKGWPVYVTQETDWPSWLMVKE